MEAGATPSGDASVDASAGEEGGGDAPLTTTQSGIPIAPVFAGFGFQYRRRKCFDEGYGACR
jgi:hypothetical protein